MLSVLSNLALLSSGSMSEIVLCFLTNLDDPPLPLAPPPRVASSSCDFSLLRRSETDSFSLFSANHFVWLSGGEKKEEVKCRVLEQFVRRAPVTVRSIFNACPPPSPLPPCPSYIVSQKAADFRQIPPSDRRSSTATASCSQPDV